MKYSLISLLFVFATHLIYAQDQQVKGRVTDGTGFPLSGATVQVAGLSSVTTANDGTFALDLTSNIPPDTKIDVTYGGQTKQYFLSDISKSSFGTLLFVNKKPVPGLEDFDGSSKYVADLSSQPTRMVVVGRGGDAVTPQPSATNTGGGANQQQIAGVSPTQQAAGVSPTQQAAGVSPTQQAAGVPPTQQAASPGLETLSTDGDNQVQVPGAEELEEVVVIGYGTVKKSDATGATGVIQDEDFNKGINTSPETLLQGKLSGIQVTSSSGEPGAGMNVRIRGTSSVRSGNNPLFVVDGFPIDGSSMSDGGGSDGTVSDASTGFASSAGSSSSRNPLNFINPADIERIDILKDASATAIYGARGANGVVLITTKRGKLGRSSVSYNGTFSMATVAKKLDLLNRDQFLERGYQATLKKAPALRRTAYDLANDFGGSTDWQDQIFRTAFTQAHDVSYSGGTKKGTYRFSLGYLNQEGTVKSTGLEKWTARFSGSQKFLNDRLEVGGQVLYALLEDKYAPISDNIGFTGDLIGAALQANPTRPVFETDRPGVITGSSPSLGGLYFQDGNVFRNPVAMLNYIKQSSTTSKVLGNVYAKLKLFDWLEYKVSLGIDHSTSTRREHYDYYVDFDGIRRQYATTRGKATLDASDVSPTNLGGVGRLLGRTLSSKLMEHTLTVNKSFSDFDVTFLAGYSYQNFANNSYILQARNFITNKVLFYNNIDGANDSDDALKSYGSSSASSFQELQSFFGRAALSYKDKYLLTVTVRADGSSKFGKNNKYGIFPSFAAAWNLSKEDFFPEFFNNFKLRAGWGIVGNQEFPGNIALAAFRSLSNGSVQLVSTANPDIRWESTSNWNVGIEFGILNNRITGTIEYYDKSTTDLITQVPTPAPAVTEYYWANLDANVINRGIEFAVNAVVIDKENFRLTLGGNVTYNQNKVENLGDIVYNTGNINGQGLSGAFSQRIVNSQPLNVFYMKEFTGFDAAGYATYADNGALKYVGSPNPDVFYGFTASAAYKDFDLTLVFNGVSGNKIYNNTANALFYPANLTTGKNITTTASTSGQDPRDISDVSTLFLEDGSFLRLQNIVLGYTKAFRNSKYVRSARLALTVQNLFVLTDYSGFDPEVNTNKSRSGVPSFGIDYYSYPQSRTFSLSLSFQF